MNGDSIKRLVRLTIAVTSFIILLAVAFGVGIFIGHWVWSACPDCPACPECVECPECREVEEYYRGVYDLCISFEVGSAFCLRAIGDAYGDGRHEVPSPGFRWPPVTEPEAAR